MCAFYSNFETIDLDLVMKYKSLDKIEGKGLCATGLQFQIELNLLV